MAVNRLSLYLFSCARADGNINLTVGCFFWSGIKSQQLLGELPWNLVQTFMFPGDKLWWLWWSSDFFFRASIRPNLKFVQSFGSWPNTCKTDNSPISQSPTLSLVLLVCCIVLFILLSIVAFCLRTWSKTCSVSMLVIVLCVCLCSCRWIPT